MQSLIIHISCIISSICLLANILYFLIICSLFCQGHGFGAVPNAHHVPPTGTEKNSGRNSSADKKGKNWGSRGPTADQEPAKNVV